LRQDIGYEIALLNGYRRIVEMVGRYLVATVVALPVTLCAGLLAFGWNIRIKFKIFGSGRVADVTLGVVLELHCTVFLAIQPDCKPS